MSEEKNVVKQSSQSKKKQSEYPKRKKSCGCGQKKKSY